MRILRILVLTAALAGFGAMTLATPPAVAATAPGDATTKSTKTKKASAKVHKKKRIAKKTLKRKKHVVKKRHAKHKKKVVASRATRKPKPDTETERAPGSPPGNTGD